MENLGNCILGTNIRRSYERRFGKLPSHIEVLHKCDNPKCRNWDHVFLGTQGDNMQDMLSKGRRTYKHDEVTKIALSIAGKGQVKWSTVTLEQVKEIRNSRNKDSKFWAEKFSVQRQVIQRILSNKTWKGVK